MQKFNFLNQNIQFFKIKGIEVGLALTLTKKCLFRLKIAKNAFFSNEFAVIFDHKIPFLSKNDILLWVYL